MTTPNRLYDPFVRMCTGHTPAGMVACPKPAALVCTSGERMQWFACDDPAHSIGGQDGPVDRTEPIGPWLRAIHEGLLAEDAEQRLMASAPPLTKYTIRFDIDVYARSPSAAMSAASKHIGGITPLLPPLDAPVPLPLGGITGAPHTGNELDGWKCAFAITESK